MRRYMVILLLLFATFLRFFMLDAQSFWNDEGNSARLSERPVALIIEGTASDIHPPLYYLLLHGWRELNGDGEFGLRSLSAFVGVGVVAVTYAAGRMLFTGRKHDFRLAFLAAAFTAINPALIYYSQETRMYSLLALWAMLSTWLLLCLPRANRPAVAALAYVAVSVAGLYTHYSYPAVLLWQNFVVALWLLLTGRVTRRFPLRSMLAWVGMMLLTFILYLPWMPIFLRQVGGRPGDAQKISAFMADALSFILLGETMAAGEMTWAVPISLGIILSGIMLETLRLRRNRPGAIQQVIALVVAIIGFIVPVMIMFAAGATRPAFFKFLVVAVPFFGLLIALGLVSMGEIVMNWTGNRPVWRVPAYGLIGTAALIFIIPAGRSLHNMYVNPLYSRADYRGIVATIAQEAHPNAGVILNAANQWEVFTYYHQQGAPVYPLPTGRPQAERIAAELEQITGRHDRLYALFWGEAERDPERLVERWLDDHAFKAREEWVGDVRLVTYAIPGEPAGQLETEVGIRFGERILLEGYTVQPDALPAGDIVQITLFWQTDVPLDKRYKVFLHLLDDQGNIVAQRDSEPGGGLALTTTWPAGEMVRDNHGLLVPADTPPGLYTLILGLYEIADPANRLITVSGRDSIILGVIEIK